MNNMFKYLVDMATLTFTLSDTGNAPGALAAFARPSHVVIYALGY